MLVVTGYCWNVSQWRAHGWGVTHDVQLRTCFRKTSDRIEFKQILCGWQYFTSKFLSLQYITNTHFLDEKWVVFTWCFTFERWHTSVSNPFTVYTSPIITRQLISRYKPKHICCRDMMRPIAESTMEPQWRVNTYRANPGYTVISAFLMQSSHAWAGFRAEHLFKIILFQYIINCASCNNIIECVFDFKKVFLSI